MGNRTTEAVAQWRKAYESEPDSFLIQIRHTKIPSCDEHIAAVSLLDERVRARQEQNHRQQIAAISELDRRVDEISGRLRKSEWATWTLRFAALGVLLTAGTIARDYFDWKVQHAAAPESSPVALDPLPETTIIPEEQSEPPIEPLKQEPSKTEATETPQKPIEQGETAQPSGASELVP